MDRCHHVSNEGYVFLLEVVTLGSFFPLLGISAKVIDIVLSKPLTSLVSETTPMFHTPSQTLHTHKRREQARSVGDTL